MVEDPGLRITGDRVDSKHPLDDDASLHPKAPKGVMGFLGEGSGFGG